MSAIVCGQSSPETLSQLFTVISFGESIRGRLLEKGKVMEMQDPDLRLSRSGDRITFCNVVDNLSAHNIL